MATSVTKNLNTLEVKAWWKKGEHRDMWSEIIREGRIHKEAVAPKNTEEEEEEGEGEEEKGKEKE